eukprot:TRINITY_DN7611_c0_g1_i1.p1 TRINITY_DN7611_c0_g1~~TRINITY_DN7611_c0_g1_i1.p1  ORF type:complete len:135 (+),score=26.58 TRINITY_DN7611_c0_g1_i1:122-526(+)
MTMVDYKVGSLQNTVFRAFEFSVMVLIGGVLWMIIAIPKIKELVAVDNSNSTGKNVARSSRPYLKRAEKQTSLSELEIKSDLKKMGIISYNEIKHTRSNSELNLRLLKSSLKTPGSPSSTRTGLRVKFLEVPAF